MRRQQGKHDLVYLIFVITPPTIHGYDPTLGAGAQQPESMRVLSSHLKHKYGGARKVQHMQPGALITRLPHFPGPPGVALARRDPG